MTTLSFSGKRPLHSIVLPAGKAIGLILRSWVTPRPIDADLERANRLVWIACGLFAITILVLIPLIGFTVERAKLAAILLGFPALGLMLAAVRRYVGLMAVPHSLESLLQLAYAMICSVMASFLVAGLAAPYSDAHLVRADALLGFAWLEHAAFVQDRLWLRHLLAEAYGTLSWQSPAAIVALGLLGHTRRLKTFVLAYVIAMAVTVVVSGLLPAKAAYGFFMLEPISDYPIASTIPDAFWLIEDIRAGGKRHLLGYVFDGIVTFPSFHAAAGVMLAWGFFAIRALRWPMVAINVAMIASTPSIGAHYLVDVIAGVVMAFASIALAKRILRTEDCADLQG